MEGTAEYLEGLTAALDKRARWLATTIIPRLKEAISSYESHFDGVMGVLIRKGLLREDPYHYDQTFTDIVVPSDEILPEFENTDELSYRLSSFRRQMKLLSTEYPVDLGTLSLARLKKLSALLFYVNWLELGEGAKSPTTKGFARAFMKVRMGSDTIPSQILKDSELQIVKVLQELRGMLADLIAYCRESWKAELRRALPSPPGAGEAPAKREELLRAMRRSFGQTMSSSPWYPALAEEVLDEELAPDCSERKSRVLSSLTVPEQEKTPTSETDRDGRETLLEAVRLLSRPHEEIATALAILEENEKLVTEARGSAWGWLRKLFRIGTTRQPADRTYKVQYAEPGSSTPKVEPIDFAAFLADTEKKASLLGVLSTGSGPAYRKLQATGQEQLAGFVDRQLNDLLVIHRRMDGLNALFQARVHHGKKRARGIKVELLTIKNSIVKANQRRHEYRDVGAG